MAVYVYRCVEHGVLEVVAPIGTAPTTATCPDCTGTATRVFTAPRLSLGSAPARALLDRTERSADSPDVVARPPSPGRTPAAPRNPALARLPRP